MSNEVWFVKQGRMLGRTDEESGKAIDGMEDGECRAFKPIGIRDPVSFRLYWGAFMTPMARYLDEVEIDRQNGQPVMYPLHKDKKRADTATKLAIKHYDEMFIAGTAFSVRTPRSISYEKMTPAEWVEYLPKVMDFLLEKVVPYIEVPEARDDMCRAIEWQQRKIEAMRERAA